MTTRDYIPGDFESSKFAAMREPYYRGLETIKSLGYTPEEYIQYFPAFCGHLTLAKFLSIAECYQRTLGIAGNIAEMGVFKGAGSLLFAKLIQIYEPTTLTQVHGFDWFQGTGTLTAEDQAHLIPGTYHEPKERVSQLVTAQGLDHIVKLHDMDMSSKAVDEFFEKYQHLQFKLVLFDIGIYDVVRRSLPFFWERLTPGGILILDQFNFDIAPGETRAVKELLPNVVIRTFPHGWMPTAYIVKE